MVYTDMNSLYPKISVKEILYIPKKNFLSWESAPVEEN